MVDAIRGNKDIAECGAEATFEHIAVGQDGGLRYAVVAVPGLKGYPNPG